MGVNILVVDDEPRYLRLMEANLVTEGFLVTKATNGQEAVDQVVEKHPDLVLLDVMMPVLDGFGALERIREFSNVPIIIVTARGSENDRVRGLDLGADDYIVKPFSATELLARCASRLAPRPDIWKRLRAINFQPRELANRFRTGRGL